MDWLLDGKTGLYTYYDYDPAGRVVGQHHPNAATTYFSYDVAGGLAEKVTVKDADSSVLVRFAYTRDAAGNPIAIERESGLGVFYYEYPSIRRTADSGQAAGKAHGPSPSPRPLPLIPLPAGGGGMALFPRERGSRKALLRRERVGMRPAIAHCRVAGDNAFDRAIPADTIRGLTAR